MPNPGAPNPCPDPNISSPSHSSRPPPARGAAGGRCLPPVVLCAGLWGCQPRAESQRDGCWRCRPRRGCAAGTMAQAPHRSHLRAKKIKSAFMKYFGLLMATCCSFAPQSSPCPHRTAASHPCGCHRGATSLHPPLSPAVPGPCAGTGAKVSPCTSAPGSSASRGRSWHRRKAAQGARREPRLGGSRREAAAPGAPARHSPKLGRTGGSGWLCAPQRTG